jgi:hypothetical protein
VAEAWGTTTPLPRQGPWGALGHHPGPLWIWGGAGTGVTQALGVLRELRKGESLDDVEGRSQADLLAFLEGHPQGILGGHGDPEDPRWEAVASRCLAFRLPDLEEDPGRIPALLEQFAAEEGVEGALPGALGALPCPGNLRGLRNRVIRWKLLAQLPLPAPEAPETLEAEDLATHLHALERTLLHRALRRSYGNRVEAAQRLGVSRRQLYLLIARHGDPVRGEPAREEGPKRLSRQRMRKNNSPGSSGR